MTSKFLHSLYKLIENGYHPIPVPLEQKGPRISAWNKLHVTKETVKRFFKRLSNIGLLTGKLIVIDIDVEDEELAEQIKQEALKRFPKAICRMGMLRS